MGLSREIDLTGQKNRARPLGREPNGGPAQTEVIPMAFILTPFALAQNQASGFAAVQWSLPARLQVEDQKKAIAISAQMSRRSHV